MSLSATRPGTRELFVKSALHFHETEMPCNWDVNIYRGCSHGCRYCFAQYSHEYLDSSDFFREIYVKKNVASILDRELSRKSWKRKRINLSGVTDAYQPVEAREQIMPQVLEVLIRHKNPVVITTKSALILRDIELLHRLASVTSVAIGSSITTTDADLQKLLEPGASPPEERFLLLKECAKAGCWTNIMATPVLPYITDSGEQLEAIYIKGKEIRVRGLSAWPLNLRGNTRKRFFEFLQQHFPDLLPGYRSLFPGWTIKPEYSQQLRDKVHILRNKYHIPGVNLPPEKEEPVSRQLQLF